MSVAINNKKLLNSNDYEKLLITKNSDIYNIKVIEKEDNFYTKNNLPLSNSFTKTIDNLNDEQTVLEVIKYYLRNHNICAIKEHDTVPYYDGRFTIAQSKISTDSYQSIDESFMALNIPPILDGTIITDLIVKKYELDRERFLYNHSHVNIYNFNSAYFSCGYSFCLDDDFNECINIDFDSSNDNELKFVITKITELLNNQVSTANIGLLYTCCSPMYRIPIGITINCDNTIININAPKLEFIENVKKVVKEYNKKVEKNKTLQLKLEGF